MRKVLKKRKKRNNARTLKQNKRLWMFITTKAWPCIP